ncbi:Gar1/Naf1 RNA binding region-domain-containing protein [Cladorrhinum samala]|uniref:H/ACA ribonucleoprotein complex non-core subunit NAF1 n=1 Tax=Cladorrhinum samala TaxID=585594 RepID=A0AAV9HMV8_9PEZI|nr:Gar1/Naf1 RNA binding region-domain-containing protein [Cladorrhinum samala]
MAENAETAETAEAAEVNDAAGADEAAGFEWDSSPYESSSDSSDSSEEDSDDEGDHPLLSMEETARILMAEVSNADEAGGKPKGVGEPIRTKNEEPDPILPKPDVVITPEMKIELLGEVKFVVENTVVVQSSAPGHVRVLDRGSVLCRNDRVVIGALAEIIGNIQNPLYTVAFESEAAIAELELTVGKPIYYSVPHANYVFTQPLRQARGTDASNLYDEEVKEDEMEFSDDELELQHKKQLKMGKKAVSRGTRENDGQGPSTFQRRTSPSTASSHTLNYDEDEDGPYRPLPRPQGYGRSTAPAPLPPKPEPSAYPSRDRDNYRGNRGRGSGARGAYRGNDRRGSYQGSGPSSGQWTQPQANSSMASMHPPMGMPQSQSQPHWQQQIQSQTAFHFHQPPPPPPNAPQQHYGAHNHTGNHQPAWNQAQSYQFTFNSPTSYTHPPPLPPPLAPGAIPVPPPGWSNAPPTQQQLQALQTILSIQAQSQSQVQQHQQGYNGQSHQDGQNQYNGQNQQNSQSYQNGQNFPDGQPRHH